MTAKIIDGKAIAAEIREVLKKEIGSLQARGITPGLATMLVGDNQASQIYVRNKHKACAEVGIASFNHVLPQNVETKSVLAQLDQLNRDPRVHGILVQLPLPPQIDTEQILLSIKPEKDADGFHVQNVGRMFAAKDISELMENKNPVPLPCTPQGCIVLIQKTGIPIAGKNAVVVGRSLIVGKPVAALLLAHHATVTITHSKTANLAEFCGRADILVAAIGKAKMITADMIKPGAVVIDVGMNRTPDGKVCGDVDYEPASEVAGWITPVPGGVGPMTIAMLLKNTVLLAKKMAA